MSAWRDGLLGAAGELLWLSQLPRLVRRLSRARGLILRLERVLPEDVADFAPNAARQIKPAFLESVIERARKLRLEIVDLDEAIRRIESEDAANRFIVFTFDDAYRDMLRHALPVLRRQQCPFTVYVTTALVDGVGEIWPQALEEIVAGQNALAVTQDGETEYLPSTTVEEKLAAYRALYRRMEGMAEAARVQMIRDMSKQYGLDLEAHCRSLSMDWTELRGLAADQLCTIGTRTVHGYDLAKLTPAEARSEIEQSRRVLRAQLGRAPVHLSYPEGAGPREASIARDLGLRSAVTTRPGGVYADDRNGLLSLPRIRLDGRLQSPRMIDTLLTPALAARLAG